MSYGLHMIVISYVALVLALGIYQGRTRAIILTTKIAQYLSEAIVKQKICMGCQLYQGVVQKPFTMMEQR